MKWRENLASQVIWLNSTGYAHSTVTLDRVGPMFCVNDYGETEYESWGGRKTWHFTYSDATREFTRRVIQVRWERNA